MFHILMLKHDEDTDGKAFGEVEWRIASSHSHKKDAEYQIELFKENGISEDQLRLEEKINNS